MGISMFDLDTEAVRARYENAMGKRATLDDADAALADIPVLLSEISRLEARLREAALESERMSRVIGAAMLWRDSDDPEHFGDGAALIDAVAEYRNTVAPSVSPVSSGEAKE